ncbi:MAG: hypothetical protein K0R69_2952 [Clostridia bacterium]|jgi:hypothetical protein|nr:hypothetical protein [Clostridia bacterium]
MSTRLEMAKLRLAMYYEAEQAILTGQSYTIGGQTLNRANLSHVVKQIDGLQKEIRRLEYSGSRVRQVIPID